jgi:hypothetical protein
MSAHLTCPRGHCWQASFDESSGPREAVCPECGSPADQAGPLRAGLGCTTPPGVDAPASPRLTGFNITCQSPKRLARCGPSGYDAGTADRPSSFGGLENHDLFKRAESPECP